MPEKTLSPAHQAFLDATIIRNRALYGGFRMDGDGATGATGATGPTGGTGATGASGATGGDKPFESITSQEQLDRILSGRLTREREKYADYDDLKAAKDELERLKAEGQTDQEKAIAAAKAEAKAEANTAANDRIVKSEARAIAAELAFKDSAIAVNSVDLSKVKVGDDGTVDEEAIKAKLNALAEQHEWMVGDKSSGDGKGKPPRPDHSQGGGGGDDAKSVSQVMAERRAAREAKEKSNN